MPMNGLNTGRDVTVRIIMPQGPVVFRTRTRWNPKQITKRIFSDGLDAPRYGEIPQGWEGTLDIDRASNALDVAIAQLEGLYWSGAYIPGGTINEGISEVSGTKSRFQYVGVVFKFENVGSYQADDFVKQSLAWAASFRKVL